MSLSTIAVSAGKGGVGKTTLAIALAQLAGWSLLDADPQRSAVGWAERRESPAPTVAAAPMAQLATQLQQHPRAVIDLPGALVGDVGPALARVDLVVIPTTDGPLELDTLPASVAIALEVGARPVVVLNRINPRGAVDALVADLAEALQVPVSPVVIRERASHRRALSVGRTAVELEPTSPAATDIRALWAWLQGVA